MSFSIFNFSGLSLKIRMITNDITVMKDKAIYLYDEHYLTFNIIQE